MEDFYLFNNKVKLIEMQSEAGAIALVHGSLQTGSLAMYIYSKSMTSFNDTFNV